MESDELRFKHVGLASDSAVVFCALDNNKTYAMPICALEQAEDWDPKANPKTVGIIHDGYAAFVKFDNKVTIDFASDFVLHVCEPSYTWHKGKARVASDVGRRIREIRQAYGLTLDALASRCGIAKPNLSRLEHDKVTPKFETLQAIASGLGISPALFFPKHAWKRTLLEFTEWKNSLINRNGSSGVNISSVEMVRVFLASHPEHRYARPKLLKHADRAPHNPGDSTLCLDADKWERALADALTLETALQSH